MRTTAGTKLALVFAVLGSAVAASFGCGSGSGDANANKTFFTTKVYPAVEPTCASCHSTGKDGAPVWLADNADGSYTAVQAMTGLIAPPSLSPLMQHGAHLGPALTDVQGSLVSQWLTMEAGPDTGANLAPTDLRDAFKRFGACMDYGDWTALGLDNVAQTGTSGGAHCTSCHNEGLASVFLSDDPVATFNHLTTFPYVERLVTGTVNDQGQFAGIVDARRFIDKGVDSAQLNANNHPTFNLGDGTGVEPVTLQNNLTKFVSNTLDRVNQGNPCTSAIKPEAGTDATSD
jgi:hypothetical protein